MGRGPFSVPLDAFPLSGRETDRGRRHAGFCLYQREQGAALHPVVHATSFVAGMWNDTFNNQHAHCHPRFTPDGKAVLYTSDLTAYSNMYLVEVGEFDELPDLE